MEENASNIVVVNAASRTVLGPILASGGPKISLAVKTISGCSVLGLQKGIHDPPAHRLRRRHSWLILPKSGARDVQPQATYCALSLGALCGELRTNGWCERIGVMECREGSQ